jgi:hypothetical protein
MITLMRNISLTKKPRKQRGLSIKQQVKLGKLSARQAIDKLHTERPDIESNDPIMRWLRNKLEAA